MRAWITGSAGRILGFFQHLVAMLLIGACHYVLQGICWAVWRRALVHGRGEGPESLLNVFAFPVLLVFKAVNAGNLDQNEGLELAAVSNSVVWGVGVVLLTKAGVSWIGRRIEAAVKRHREPKP